MGGYITMKPKVVFLQSSYGQLPVRSVYQQV